MRIIHSGSCNILAGGPALSTWLTIKGCRACGCTVDLIMEPVNNGKIISNDLKPIFTKQHMFGGFAYVPDFEKTIAQIGDADIYHVQGVWMLHGTQLASYARKHKKPYVVTLRGMLYPEALSHNSLVKKLSLLIYQGKTLRKAAAIQVTCREEMDHYRALGFKNPVAIIPNPIETEGIIDQPLQLKKQFRVGYLGRVHPRKRIERLIYSFGNLKNKLPGNAELLIIGGGDKSYEKFLRNEVSRLKLDNVRFTGFLSGKEKEAAIKSLSILGVTSDFENFGNIVTEALVYGIPVIASQGMPWQELPMNGCGWWIPNDQDSIDKTILEAFSLGPEKLRDMGMKGRELMLKNYSVEALGEKMKQLYQWILGETSKPDFVYD